MKLNYPSWHFIGSKYSSIPWIFDQIKDLNFTTVLDLFGGTGVMSHAFRLQHRSVFYNDFLKYLQISAFGLLNSTNHDIISIAYLKTMLDQIKFDDQPSFLTNYLSDSYFFPVEAKWIEKICQFIDTNTFSEVQNKLLFFALSQSCLKKRPFHTFHGSFLNLRLKERDEPQTWDLDMNQTFFDTISEINTYLKKLQGNFPPVSVFGYKASSANPDLFTDVPLDLVYIDPPFISNKKKRTLKFANYVKNYHVLELLANYKILESLKNPETDEFIQEKYLPIQEMELWLDQNQTNWLRSFENIIKNFQTSTIVVSYRSDSLISKNEIVDIIGSYKNVSFKETPHVYEIKEKISKFQDLLFVGQ